MRDIGKYRDLLNSDDPQRQLEGANQFRKLLSIEHVPPIDAVIEAQVVPRFVQFLSNHQYPDMQFEAAWALTNISSGNTQQTEVVVESHAIRPLVQLLRSPRDDVREQAIWCLGNIAGDSSKYRDLVLEAGGMEALLSTFNENMSKMALLRNSTWTLSNFCRGRPVPPLSIVEPALGKLRELLQANDDEVLMDACWALSFISDGINDRIQAVLNANVCHRLVELMMHSNYHVRVPALRTIGNIVTGDDHQTAAVIQVNALPSLWQLLRSNKKAIKKEAAWTVSNITAGTRQQIDAVIEAGLIEVLVELIETSDYDVKREAVWAISNATTGGSGEQIRELVNRRCIEALCSVLSTKDIRINVVALDALKNILDAGEVEARRTAQPNPYSMRVEECRGLSKLEMLQIHDAHDVYIKAYTILLNFFSSTGHPDAVTAPEVNMAGNFQFGADPNAFAQPAVNIPPTGQFTFHQ